MSLSKKNCPLKGLCGRCFICLRPPSLLYTCIVEVGWGEGGANEREGQRGNSSQSRSKISTCISCLQTLFLSPVKTTFTFSVFFKVNQSMHILFRGQDLYLFILCYLWIHFSWRAAAGLAGTRSGSPCSPSSSPLRLQKYKKEIRKTIHGVN